ncbi:MAG: hypothetical protein NPIRA05_07270 [Nitrospirales bacterium]|nr:MAG: hypothetical protein NPIRA05_07270 [Nitrospirales bacterium]
MTVNLNEIVTREQRAYLQFHIVVEELLKAHAPASLHRLADALLFKAKSIPQDADYWEQFRGICESLTTISYRHGTLAQAVEWETLKLQTRLASARNSSDRSDVPLFRDRHVHIGTLILMWCRLSLETENELAKQGYPTLLDVGPWGGFNFVVQDDGYTRMPFARLTLAVGSLPNTPLEEQGGPFYQDFLPRYLAALETAGEVVPNKFNYQHHKQDDAGRLQELSCTYHFPHHTYERRSFVKIRLSRAYETVEEITLHDFLGLLERLHFTRDWDTYKEQTQDIDVRFDLQDFISLSHTTEGIYQRTPTEEALLIEIKDAFRGAIRERKALYRYMDEIRNSKWIENLYWGVAQTALGIKKYQRPVSFAREVCSNVPPRLLIPVRRHLQAYHERISSASAK